jgi:hypothetical protein
MQPHIQSLAQSYNQLLSIRDAHDELERLGGERVVGAALNVIVSEGMQDHIGIRLLHKHNDVNEDEVMLESSLIDEDGFALVTEPLQVQNLDGTAPNSWRTTSEGFIPIEFSEPELLKAQDFDINLYAQLFDKLSKVLKDHAAAMLLGPCLDYGTRVTSKMPCENAAFLEKTDSDRRANVVRYLSRDNLAFVRSARTKWSAKQMIDERGKLTWTTTCNCFCSVFPKGGHQGTKTHRYTPPGGDD